MEILETQDPEKRRLMAEANRHKASLADEARIVSERTEKVITNAIVIGGALALTYFLVRQLSGSKSKKKKTKTVSFVAQPPSESNAANEGEEENDGSSILSQIGTKIANEATVFLLNLAKEKLNEFLNAGKETVNENH
jgi:DNA replication initiation complex subunit (GINS family)